jgi:hypothetical protein
MKNRKIVFAAILSILPCLALLPMVRAVVPAPDGGYPGGNTAEGQTALLNLTNGEFNTAIGDLSLRSNTTASFNTGVGAGTLGATTTAGENTAVGAGALLGNTTGDENAALGAFALVSNTTGGGNTAVGDRALQNNLVGGGHTAVGSGALMHTTANGLLTSNTAVGASALVADTNGGGNTAVGGAALLACTTGGGNTAVGLAAGSALTTGGDNIILGAAAGSGITTASHTICIGTDGNNVDSACYIGNIFGSTSASGIPVLVNTNGRLGTMTSSARFKDDIKPMAKASEALFALKPVSFRYKKAVDPEGDGKSQFGLVAEEVEKVNPELVVRDKEGKPYSVRYDQVNTMLLNEFLKAHQTIQELKTTVAQQKQQIDALAEGLQRVSAQIEVSKPARGLAASNQ